MSALEFISKWKAVPFAPFRVIRADGTTLRITDPGQVAAPSDLRRFVIMTGTGLESLTPDDLESCTIAADLPSPTSAAASAPPAEDPTAAMMREVLARVERDRLRRSAQLHALGATRAAVPADPATHRGTTPAQWLLSPAVADGTGAPCFSLVGTRFDLHGIEQFENGISLFVHHLDDPLTEHRFIIWPPEQGTLKTFSEAQPLAELAADAARLDAIITDTPTREPKETKRFTSPPMAHEPVRQPRAYDDRFGPQPEVDKSRFALTLDALEVARHMMASRPLLTDTLASAPLLDLTATSWDCEVSGSPESPTLALRHYPDGGRWTTATIDAPARTATIDGSTIIPVRFLQQHLANFGLHHRWHDMLAALRAGPVPLDEPEIRIHLPSPRLTGGPGDPPRPTEDVGGWTVEFWGAGESAPLPFLWPRIVRGDGVSLLDWRGAPFGAGIIAWNKPGLAGLTFHPVIADARERQKNRRNVWIVIDLPSRRVTSAMLPGSTSLGVLHHLGRTCRTLSWFLQDLEEALARGIQLPLPEPGTFARADLLQT